MFLAIFDKLSAEFSRGRGNATSIGVNLTKIIKLENRTGELFLPLEAGKANKAEQLSTLIDQINRRYGRKVVQHGFQHEHLGFFDRG
jgi:DNA polymerase-4